MLTYARREFGCVRCQSYVPNSDEPDATFLAQLPGSGQAFLFEQTFGEQQLDQTLTSRVIGIAFRQGPDTSA
ncbi:hypothetical protein C8R30_1327 [Nitrosomonas nitrosa]|nr:hypothetical protein C8R30_1327 [Nitrosomonas nitrosa]